LLLKTESITETIKYVVKIKSIALILTLKIFEMPFLTLLLESYVCEEDMVDSEYALIGIVCNDGNYIFSITISTIILTFYIIFLIVETILYSS
jgi:hypothetical protein